MIKRLVSVIVPVYMNEGSLLDTHKSIVSTLAKVSSKWDFEIVYINDGSKDNSLKTLLEIKKTDSHVKLINFTRNFGQVAAIYAGFKYAKGDVVINISADMQDPTELMIQMLEKWEHGSSVVICTRTGREEGLLRQIPSKIFYSLMKIGVPQMPEGGFDYFLLDKTVYKEMEKLDDKHSFLQGDILWFSYNISFIGYKRLKRTAGKSQWSLSKRLKYFIDGLLSTSYLPIRAMTYLGLVTSFLGFGYAIIVIITWSLGETPFKGYAPILIVILLTSGLIMIMLGIIGEYQWRIYDEIRKRPRFIVKDEYLS